MHEYKLGDIVDIKANASIHKGMPHKFYHGRTGIVFNVTKSSVGVIVNKYLNGRIIKKRVNLRVEHVRHSKSRSFHIERVKQNEAYKAQVRSGAATHKSLKRVCAQPEPGKIVPRYCKGVAVVDEDGDTTYNHPTNKKMTGYEDETIDCVKQIKALRYEFMV
jgi:large subunit ribosomal protein L21e